MTDAVLAAAHEAIQKGSKSFALASRLFDGGTRDRATLLYAWCRHCDDVIDGQWLGARDALRDVEKKLAERDGLRERVAREHGAAALARIDGDVMHLQGLVGSAADGRAVRAQGEGHADAPDALGLEVAQMLLAQGARGLIDA